MYSNRTLEEDLRSVCVVGFAEWSLVIGRLIFNSFTVILALCMIWFIAKRPALHSNTFNVLFLSSFVVDILANLSRILLKYLPSMMCSHWLIISFVGAGTPLATIINASEWYLSYASICCGFFFNFDHMILVVFPQYYAWACHVQSFHEMEDVLVDMDLWILPMMHRCCRSNFMGETAATVFINSDIQDLYDTADVLLEAFFYVPIVFIFNCLTICVLQYRYRKCLKLKKRSGVLKDLGRSGLLELPGVEWVKNNFVGDQPYLRIEVRASGRRQCELLSLKFQLTYIVAAVTQHRKIVDELDLSLINLIDQMIDAIGVLFYMFFWAANNNWVKSNAQVWMNLYDVCWELSTVTQPYIFLAMFADIRREFFGFYSSVTAVDQQKTSINPTDTDKDNGHSP
ncbi:hypothetical protein M3Y98_00785700 [Aphelenchoides besseyi]|nr:hypothetical protein M3Y98_00785700 [Aphelenchoides besseyi]KAI6211882.1 hypothetical protein M3Y96_00481200 [Aphelenchoides besseyi]